MDPNANLAAITLQILGNATHSMTGAEVPIYVDVNNWLSRIQTGELVVVPAHDDTAPGEPQPTETSDDLPDQG